MDQQFTATFSYFSPNEKEYFDCVMKFDAADRYAAREKAWEVFERKFDETIYCEGPIEQVKLCGIGWKGNPLDVQDYFDAQADACDCEINRIHNVELANYRINPAAHENKFEEGQRDLYAEHSCQRLLDTMAKELYGAHGIVPPSLHTKLYYAEKMSDSLYCGKDFELANQFSQNLWDASQWKASAMDVIQNLFRNRYLYHNEGYHDMGAHFARDGCYPCATTQRFEMPMQPQEMTQA